MEVLCQLLRGQNRPRPQKMAWKHTLTVNLAQATCFCTGNLCETGAISMNAGSAFNHTLTSFFASTGRVLSGLAKQSKKWQSYVNSIKVKIGLGYRKWPRNTHSHIIQTVPKQENYILRPLTFHGLEPLNKIICGYFSWYSG